VVFVRKRLVEIRYLRATRPYARAARNAPSATKGRIFRWM